MNGAHSLAVGLKRKLSDPRGGLFQRLTFESYLDGCHQQSTFGRVPQTLPSAGMLLDPGIPTQSGNPKEVLHLRSVVAGDRLTIGVQDEPSRIITGTCGRVSATG